MNLIAYLLSGLATTILGYIWYGAIFPVPYHREMNLSALENEKRHKSMRTTMIASYIGYAITASVLDITLTRMHILNLSEALIMTSLLWLGLPAMVTLMNTLYRGGSLTLYAINTFYVLAYMLASTCIIFLLS